MSCFAFVFQCRLVSGRQCQYSWNELPVVERKQIAARLDEEFSHCNGAVRPVSRQARDLVDAGYVAEDLGYQLTPDAVVSNLQDAPDGYTLEERWNWWVGSLELAYGSRYSEFRVQTTEES